MNISGVKQWLSGSAEAIQRDGIRGIDQVLLPPYREVIRQVSRPIKSGQNIYEAEWDVLLVLDGCRLDLMKEVVAKQNLDWEVGEIESVDTMTRFWMEKTFIDKYSAEMAKTVFLCANPHSDELLDEDKFHTLDEIWKYRWDEETGTCLAKDVTDKSILLRRKYPQKRLLIHYIQPHNPFVTDLELNTKPTESGGFIQHNGKDPWHRLEDSEVSEERVWTAYRENLEYVLNEVKRLLQNMEADTVVITSDHGNAKGEWGLYGHPFGMPFRCLRTVPWIEVSATDTGECQPEFDSSEQREDGKVEKRLQALGYK